jgi:hypothetical protein
MSDFYKLHFWRPAAGFNSITPCDRTDERLNRCEIECFGPGRDTHVFLRDEGETLLRFIYRIQGVETLMKAAHWQGRRFQAGVMREALEVR